MRQGPSGGKIACVAAVPNTSHLTTVCAAGCLNAHRLQFELVQMTFYVLMDGAAVLEFHISTAIFCLQGLTVLQVIVCAAGTQFFFWITSLHNMGTLSAFSKLLQLLSHVISVCKLVVFIVYFLYEWYLHDVVLDLYFSETAFYNYFCLTTSGLQFTLRRLIITYFSYHTSSSYLSCCHSEHFTYYINCICILVFSRQFPL